MKRLLPALLLLLPFSLAAELEISDAWIKNLPPSVPVRAGYMTLRNTADQPRHIVGAHSKAFASIEIHQTISQDGMMHMQPLPTLSIDPGSELQLAPGGIHLMMMQPNDELKPGDRIVITLEFESGSAQQLELTVRQ